MSHMPATEPAIGRVLDIDASGNDPAAGSLSVQLYGKTLSSITQLFALASDGTSYQLTPPPTPAALAGAHWVNAKTDHGAAGNGVADDRAAVLATLNAAATAAAAGTGNVIAFFPAGTYNCSRDGSNAYSIDVPGSGYTILGSFGRTWFRHPTGMPNTSVALFRISGKSNIVVRDCGFDGNWGNSVGGTDDNTGINHTSQVDPKNYLLMLRGSDNITVENCFFRQAYGDCIWMGSSAADFLVGCTNVKIGNVVMDMSARNGISLAQRCEGVHVDRLVATNIFATAFDTEPVDQYVRNVTLERSYLGGWWNLENPGRSVNSSLSIAGGKFLCPGEQTNARQYRISDCTIIGSVIIEAATDVVLERNRIICDWSGYSYSPVMVQMYTDDIRIVDNFIYDRTEVAPGGGNAHDAAISVQFYASANNNQQPANVTVSNNTIRARNGRTGIKIEGTGGRSLGSGAVVALVAGTATGVTETSMTDTGKAWTTDQWQGYRVRMGAAWATIASNTATVLTLYEPNFGAGASTPWNDPLGVPTTTPSVGAYEIWGPTGVVKVEANDIDCTNDGRGAGSHGVHLMASRAGMRVKVRGNTIRNANTYGIYVQSTDANRVFKLLELIGNTAIDDQLTPTCTAAIGFNTPHITKWIMRGNSVDGVAAAISGLSSGTWLVIDGHRQEWEGFGSPESVVTASVGSRYWRVDGGANTTLYVKESGAGTNTGWVAK